MEKYIGKLVSGDFEHNTMEFEIQGEFTLSAGEFYIIRKEDFDNANKPIQ